MLSHAARSITKGFSEQGFTSSYTSMYPAIIDMVRKKVTDSLEAESVVPNAQEEPPRSELEPSTLDQSAISIDELWSTLFGLSNSSENDPMILSFH
jgi:hypothetical protein